MGCQEWSSSVGRLAAPIGSQAARRAGYTIRLPANSVLQHRTGYLMKRPVGRRSHAVRPYLTSFSYQAQSWSKPRRVVAKVEWDPGELYPRVGFIVTNLPGSAERVVAFYNQRGTREQYIKEGRDAIKWTRLSRCSFAVNAVRLQLHVLAYNVPPAVCKLRFTGMSDQSGSSPVIAGYTG